MKRALVMATAAAFGCCGAALAQMVTPPPATTPDDTKDIVRYPAPAPVVPQRPENWEEMKARAQPILPPKKTDPEAGFTKDADLPKLEYTSLVVRDAQKRLMPLAEPVEMAALRVNPMLTPEFFTRPEVVAALAERSLVLRRLAVDNLDILEKIDEGMVEQTKIDKDKVVLANLRDTLRPVSVGNSDGQVKKLLVDLYDKKLLNGEQAGFARKIVKEHGKAELDDLAGNVEELMKMVMKNQTIEVTWEYHAMCREAAGMIPELIANMPLEATVKQMALEAAKSYKPTLDADQKLKVYRDATAGMTLSQRQDVLRGAMERRNGKS